MQNKVPGVLGIGTSAATNLPSIFRGLSTTFPMSVQRDILNLGVKYRLTDELGANLAFTTTHRNGNQPYGASFAFNDANEIPMSINTRTNDLTAGLEWAKASTGMVRVEWNGSWFKNDFPSLTWDNPLRATDYTNGKLPPAGPYDASGYVNGNGPAVGRLAMAPSNSLNTFSALGMYKLPNHTTVNAELAFTSMKSDEALLPWTTNSQITTPTVYALFPGLARLERATAEAEVRVMNAVLNIATRPLDNVSFDLRYRYNNHENVTPMFDAGTYVRFDAVPETIAGDVMEPFKIRRSTLEGGASFSLPRNTAFRIGYILDDVKRSSRAFNSNTDHTFRASLDTYGNQYYTVRAVFENTNRVGSGFSIQSIEDGGGQPGLRYYDESDMTRNKGTLILQVMPIDKFDFGLSLATGKDTYKGEGHEFGLLSNDNTAYNVTLAVYPWTGVTLGGNYGVDQFKSLQKARNANPFSGVAGAYESWLDPNRDWYLNNNEKVNNAGAYLDLIKLVKNTDVRFSLDFSDSDNAFKHSGPRVEALKSNTTPTAADLSKPCATGFTSCFIPLPNVTNQWTQIRVDVKHMFTSKLGIGLGYWYENFEVTDFATTNLSDGSPRMDPLGAITTGYGNRPYEASTGMFRVIYKF